MHAMKQKVPCVGFHVNILSYGGFNFSIFNRWAPPPSTPLQKTTYLFLLSMQNILLLVLGGMFLSISAI